MSGALTSLRAPRDVDAAYAAWGANCGPASLAAALGLDVADVRDAVSPFAGYMNVKHMLDALDKLDVKAIRVAMTTLAWIPSLPHPMILSLVAWTGPWSLVPRAAAAHRHWVVRHPAGIYDVGCGWVTYDEWDVEQRPLLIPPRGDGTYTIARASVLQSFRGQQLR